MAAKAKLKRRNLGITLPKTLVAQIDGLRADNSIDKEMAGRDRGAAVEILLKRGMKAGR